MVPSEEAPPHTKGKPLYVYYIFQSLFSLCSVLKFRAHTALTLTLYHRFTVVVRKGAAHWRAGLTDDGWKPPYDAVRELLGEVRIRASLIPYGDTFGHGSEVRVIRRVILKFKSYTKSYTYE